jgi:hypothetical protein
MQGDPILFKKQLGPLKKFKYDIDKILEICYPLRGCWSWDFVLNTEQEKIFKMVHIYNNWFNLDTNQVTDTPDVEKDTRFFITAKCLDNHAIYKSLLEFLPEESSEETLDWPEETCESESVYCPDNKFIETFVKPIRDNNWKFKNPAFNPRLISDIKDDYVLPPNGYSKTEIIEFIEKIKNLKPDEYITTDATLTTDIKNSHDEFGIVGKPHCLKSVKCLLFFKNAQAAYSLDMSVDEYVAKAEQRKNRWLWIRVGNGYYRDFNWMFIGNQDMITKTIITLESMGYKEEQVALTTCQFDFEIDILWKMSGRKCYNLDTGQTEIKENIEWYDEWGWTLNKIPSESKIKKIRGFIFKKFMEQYPEQMLLGKKNAWTKNFLALLNKNEIIDFTTRTPIKYTAAASQNYHFSKLGFALSKKEVNWTVEQIERCIRKYK